MDDIARRESNNRIPAARSIGVLFLIAAAVFGAYANTLNAPFVFDDLPDIRNNPHIRITDLSLPSIRDAMFKSPCANRPVANFSFALNYYLHAYNPLGYRLVNVTIHILNGFMVYWFFLITLRLANRDARTPSEKRMPGEWIAACAALLWVLHPLQIQSVTYIVQRMTSLAVFFCLVALLCYLGVRLAHTPAVRRTLFACGLLAFLLSLGVKEIAIVLPVLILFYEWIFFRNLSVHRMKGPAIAIGFCGLLLVPVVWLYIAQHPNTMDGILRGFTEREFNLTQRLTTQFRVLLYYISLIAVPLPSRFLLDYDYPGSLSLVAPLTTLMSLPAHLALVVLAWRSARRETILCFAIIWFYLTLLIESSLIALEMAYEHRLYLPSMMVFLAGVACFARPAGNRRLRVIALSLAVIFCFGATLSRNRVWQSELSLWRDTAAKSPGKARPLNNLGLALKRAGHIPEAGETFQNAIRMDPLYVEAYTNLGQVLALQGDLEGSIRALEKAVELAPDNHVARNNLGNAYFATNRMNEALREYRRALDIDPYYAHTYANIGLFLTRTGRIGQSVPYFRKAIAIDPRHTRAKQNLAGALAELQKYEEALSISAERVRLEPDNPLHYYSIAALNAALGNIEPAIQWLAKALDKGYDNIERIMTDPLLASIRTSEAFAELINTHNKR